jgi:hypothetical protein
MTKEEIILKLENKMTNILKLENQIFIAKLYEREYSVKDLEEVLTYLNQQK